MLISIQNNTKHAMQSPWLTDERNNDHRHQGQQQVPEYGFTAELGFERSTSAPPPGTSLLFGSSRSSRDENVGTGVKVSFILNDVMSCHVIQCDATRCDVM
jgi:hypothetical protein